MGSRGRGLEYLGTLVGTLARKSRLATVEGAFMASDQSLNDIGPGINIKARDGRGSVRFRLPADIAQSMTCRECPGLRPIIYAVI